MDARGGCSCSATSTRLRVGARGRTRSCPSTSCRSRSVGSEAAAAHIACGAPVLLRGAARNLAAVCDAAGMTPGGQKVVRLVGDGHEDAGPWVAYYRMLETGAEVGPP